MLGKLRTRAAVGSSALQDADGWVRDAAIEADRAVAAEAGSVVATSSWRELVLARWSLVDAFESGGRRYLVARGSQEEEQRSLALDTLDRLILAERASGASLKVIAAQVGLSISAVGRRLRSAMGRLGLRSNGDLASLFRGVAR